MTDTRPYIDTAPPRGAGERQVERSSTGSAEGPGHPHRPPTRELRRVVASDARPRRLAMPTTMAQLFLRFDAGHDLPHVVETETGLEVARFRLTGDVALFIGTTDDRQTLPQDYLEQLVLAGGRGGQ